jgi:ribosome biogenesis protein UTP30
MVAQSTTTPASTVDPALLNRAITALLKHHSSTSSSNQLLSDDLAIQVQFTLARIPGRPSAKPVRIDIPHSLHDNDDDNNSPPSVCLIVKDESKPSIQKLISRFPSELSSIQKVLTLTSLRTKHKSYEQKRLLLSRYDVFMADDRILPMLSKALGSKFFEKKKQPIPVNICREEALPFVVGKNLLKATFLWVGSGTCVTVK